ncbi:MAG: helicase DnaB [Methylobacterium sp.]|nr:helicase DnaB [Methylobacterium sp.]
MSGRVVPFSGQAADETPPQSIDTEQGLLGALLHNNDVLRLVAPIVGPEHFFAPEHAAIFSAISSLVGQGLPATLATLKPFLGDEDLGGFTTGQYLARLLAESVTVSGAPGYARIIRSLAVRRDLMKAGRRLADRARFDGPESTADDMIDEVEEALLAARGASPAQHLVSMTGGEGASWLLERIEARRRGEAEPEATPTGIPDLDNDTGGGFGRGDLWLLAGRPGMGKTIAMTSLSRLAARHSGVLVFQLEVKPEQQHARYLADLSYAAHRPLTFGQIMRGRDLDDEDMWRLRAAQKRLAQLNLRVDCRPSISVAEIVHSVRAEKRRLERLGQRLGVVFLDYLKFIRVSDRYAGQRVLEIGEISGALKSMAKAEDVCVVLLAQLNRGVEAQGREDRRPTVADLRDSGELEQDADVVLLLYRDAFYLEKHPKLKHDAELQSRLIDKRNSVEFILGKNRAGPTRTLELWCDVASSTIAAHARGPA